jgi:hypothetical protein
MPVPSDASFVLEQIIDASSIERLLELIADVCHEKAEHLRSAWQDANAAKSWERDAAKLLKLAPKFEN